MQVHQIIRLARKHVIAGETEMLSSAELCLSDAILLYAKGDFENARTKALKSLAYSVGVFHVDYINASK